MRVERIELRQVSLRLKSPFETSFGVETDHQCLLVSAFSDGLQGWGEVPAAAVPGYSYETVGTAWHILEDFLVPAVLRGEIGSMDDYLRLIQPFRGHPMAKAGLEGALWDLLAQRAGQSLSQYLGGTRAEVTVGVSVGVQKDIPTLLRVIQGYLDQGYPRIKIKIKPGRDLPEARAVREAFPSILLQVDANSAYDLSAAGLFRQMDELNLLLIEQPLAEDDIFDHRHLQAGLKTPICLDESILSVRHARWALELDSCRVINIKAGRVSGLNEARLIHDHCRERDVPVWCGGMLETGVGRAANVALASLPGFTLPGDISATDRYYEQDVTHEAFVLNRDGTLTVPTRPGIGVSIEREALAKVTLRCEGYAA